MMSDSKVHRRLLNTKIHAWLRSGEPRLASAALHSVVIAETAALRIFGNACSCRMHDCDICGIVAILVEQRTLIFLSLSAVHTVSRSCPFDAYATIPDS